MVEEGGNRHDDDQLAAPLAHQPVLMDDDDFDGPLFTDLTYDQSANAQYSPCLIGSTGYRISTQDTQSRKEKQQLIMATSLCFLFMIAEIIGGYMAGSLAIMADAAHLLSDCISFIVAIIAIWLSRKPPDDRMTFGYKRAEVLGAIISILGIWLLTTFLFYFAIYRLVEGDFDIDADTMMIVSGIGVCINVVMAFVLHGSCNFVPHAHSHSHSHTKPPKSTGPNHKYKPLMNDSNINESDHLFEFENQNNNHFIKASNGMIRSDSVCSFRSPSHSRTNSFSKSINSTDLPRRPSASLLQLKLKEAALHRNSNGSIEGRPSSRYSHVVLPISEDEQQHVHRDSLDSISMDNQLIVVNSEKDKLKKNINIQAAVIHVIGDFIQSIGVFIAAIIIKFYPSAKIADPICTFVFSIVVIFTTIRIMKDSIICILDAVPSTINLQKLSAKLSLIEGVRSVHHLNVWSVSVDWNVMSVHLIIDALTDSSEILYNANKLAKKSFDIKHSTIQLERDVNNYHFNNILVDRSAGGADGHERAEDDETDELVLNLI